VSGIAAIVDRDEGIVADLIGAFLARMRHRGPDRSGVLTARGVALGQCMLETTPEDALDPLPLRRPSRGSGGELWIAADARLDNRDDLLAAREAACGRREPASDAALILWAYEQWAEACPTRLLGDFAFVIWESRRQQLFCVRDPLGVRPLYYRDDAYGFRCASEMQALLADPRVPRRVHQRSARLFLAYQYSEQDETLREGVRALPSGHSLLMSGRGLKLTRYWTPEPGRAAVSRTPEERAEQFRDALTEAVRCRMRSNRPVAGHVSGGLDSSSVVSVAARLHAEERVTGPPITPLRLAFDGLACDETPYSQSVIDRWSLAAVTRFPLMRPELCEPDPSRSLGDVYFHPTVAVKDLLFEAATERGIRTTLTGTGSDQLMHRTGFECASLLRRGNLRLALAEASAGRPPLRALRTLAATGILPFLPLGVQEAVRRSRSGARRLPWLSTVTLREVEDDEAATLARLRQLDSDPAVAAILECLMHGPDLGLGFARLDRHAARYSTEERHPFLDLRVVELLLSVPCEDRSDRGVNKQVLRRAMAGTLPELVRTRQDSADFTSYLRAGFLEPFRRPIERLFEASLLEAGGYVDGRRVREALRGGTSEVPAFHVANLVALELWLRCEQQ
jgi:asparagine synthase (glutamine-hydrolysing)